MIVAQGGGGCGVIGARAGLMRVRATPRQEVTRSRGPVGQITQGQGTQGQGTSRVSNHTAVFMVKR